MKKIFGFFTFIYCSLFGLISVFATTLQEAIQLAYKNSEAVYMKYYQKDLAKIDSYKMFSNFLPSVDVSYSFMPFNKFKNNSSTDNGQGFDPALIGTMSPTTQQIIPDIMRLMDGMVDDKSNNNNSHMIQMSATASLSLYKTIPSYIASKKNVNASTYEYNEFLENFGLLFIQKYMDVIYYTKAKEVYEQMSETYDKKLKKVTVMNAYGSAKRDKVVLAEAQLYENKANEITTKSSLDKAKMEYKILTGAEPDDLQVPDMNNVILPAKNKQEFIDLVLRTNSSLRKIEQQHEAQRLALMAQNFNILPDIFASYSLMYMNNKNLNITNNYIGIGASWSFNGRGKPILESRKSYTNYRIAGLNRTLKIKELEQDAGYNWDQYFAMVELVKATEKALKASRDSLKEVKISVSTGTATFIDEMDIETQYLNANLNYLKAQKALILAYYQLISMTGVGFLPVK